MFWDTKTRIFRKLKALLRNLEKTDSDMKRREFEDALKDLRIGYIENKQLFDWLKKKHSSRIDKKNLTYGCEHLEQQFEKAQNILMEIRGKFGREREYSETLTLIREMEMMVIWEIKSQKQHLKHNLDVMNLSQEQILEEIRKSDRMLVRIINKYKLDDPVNFITIRNEKKEKKQFMQSFKAGQEYNPQFKYKPIPRELVSKARKRAEDVMAQLRSLKIDFAKGAGYLVAKKWYNLKSTLNLVRAIGTSEITKYSMQLYGFPTDSLLNEAYQAIEASTAEVEKELQAISEEKKYSVEEFKKRIDAFFKENHMAWKTVIKSDKDMDARFKTVNVSREFWVNKQRAPFSEKDILKAIEHECKIHAYRYESGRNSPLKILTYGTSGYLPTEEGLSHYFEDLKGVASKTSPESRHLYVIAEYLAMRGGFYYCFSELMKYGITPDRAWSIVVRIKRGLSDTGEKGGFFKDHVYFLGEKLINEFVASGGNVNDLLIGKISVNDIKYLTAKYKL
jgi:hypothetical protein